MITRAQQHRNATATRLDSSDFFVRRLEEYERTLSVLTTRIEESYTHKKLLNRLLTPVTWHLERAERDMDWFEESATQPGDKDNGVTAEYPATLYHYCFRWSAFFEERSRTQ